MKISFPVLIIAIMMACTYSCQENNKQNFCVFNMCNDNKMCGLCKKCGKKNSEWSM